MPGLTREPWAGMFPVGAAMKFSIVIPAHNEEKYLGGCLESVRLAAAPYPGEVETIVVLNRCRDGTERIAVGAGARIVREDAKCLARIRNAGAREAMGEILVTIDADSRMPENMLGEIDRALASGKIVGGGARFRPDRYSLGIRATMTLVKLATRLKGLAGVSYWCRLSDFLALGGFNEKMIAGEDLEFAARLKKYGGERGLRFVTLPRAYVTVSMRKFDHFGDWHFLRTMARHASRENIGKLMRGEHSEALSRFADEYFYEWEKDPAAQKCNSECIERFKA